MKVKAFSYYPFFLYIIPCIEVNIPDKIDRELWGPAIVFTWLFWGVRVEFVGRKRPPLKSQKESDPTIPLPF